MPYRRDPTIVTLMIIGLVLMFIATMLAMMLIICAMGWNAPSVATVCTSGSFKEVALILIGSAGALWGANRLQRGS
jgi:hypothetical protein